MKKYALVFALFTAAFLSGCANLPGTFPDSGVFKGPYVKEFQSFNIVGEWHMIANGRIYKLDIKMADGKPIITSSLGIITHSEKLGMPIPYWDTGTRTLSFRRTVDQSHKLDTIDIVQDFTGHLMTYSKTANPQIDYKWRMAGTFTHVNTDEFPTSGWYATRPRE